MSVFLVVSVGAVALIGNNQESDAGYVIDSDKDYVKTGGSFTFTVENRSTDKVYCSWDLNDSSGKSQNNGTVDVGGTPENVDLTAPSTAGDYTFVVKFYSTSDKSDADFITERQKSLKVVDPVTITVNFENKGDAEISFDAYLMVKNKDGGWDKIDDSTKTVKVSAYNKDTDTPGKGTYTCDYVVRDLDGETVYKVCSDDEIAKNVKGLNTEMSFYTSQNNYSFISWFLIIILFILIIMIVWIYRKPVKNYGKPKGRK